MKSTIKEYRYIGVLLLISVVMQTIVKSYSLEQTVGSVIFLFLGSLLLSGSAVGLHRKYNPVASHIKWWTLIYIFMILIAAIPE